MEIFAHRSNDIPYLYLLYWQRYVRCFEVDVQPTKDGVIIVYHDDCSHLSHREVEALHNKQVYTLVEFLRCTPDDITLNIEIKRYTSLDCSQAVVEICKEYKGAKDIIYSSFDIDMIKGIRDKGLPYWLLLDTIPNNISLKELSKLNNICVNISVLEQCIKSLCSDVNISVYGLHEHDIVKYWSESSYSRVVNWIVDYYDTLKFKSKSIA